MSGKQLFAALGHKLINAVRDRSIKRFDNVLSGHIKAKALIDLHNSLNSFDL